MSTLQFGPGEWIAGSTMRGALEAASDELVRRGQPAIRVVSGDRSYAKQVEFFLARYVRAGTQGNRKVYDFKWWNGVLWARVSPAGTVAPPSPSAPHIAGIAADLGYPYNAYTAARNVLLDVVSDLRLPLRNTGTGFGEVWHWESTAGAGSPSSGGGAVPFPVPIPIPRKKSADVTVYLKVLENPNNTPGLYGRVGLIYANDVGGVWRGISNLEYEVTVKPYVTAELAMVKDIYVGDFDALVTVAGVWEQEQIETVLPLLTSSLGRVIGLGPRTGRMRIPGSSNPDLQGWHYPPTDPQVDMSAAVNVHELASAVVPELATLLEAPLAGLAGLSDEDVSRLADASADEQDRRTRERLAE